MATFQQTGAEQLMNSHDLSAVEVFVLLRGVEIGDRAALKLVLKETVARGYLAVVPVEEWRRFGLAKRTPVATLGPSQNTVTNPVLRTVLEVVRHGRPQVDGSAHQKLKADLDIAFRSLEGSPSIGQALEVGGKMAKQARISAYPGGVVGVPLLELAGVLLLRHQSSGRRSIGWRRLTHGFVPDVVLPLLETAGLMTSGRAVTDQGTIIRARYQDRLDGGERSIERALTIKLRTLAAPSGACDAAFTAIDKAVEGAWHGLYGD
jgi:hypothetical protein